MSIDHKPIVWIGSSLKDLLAMPSEVRRHIGFALRAVQAGEKPAAAKPLKGFGGAGVLEIVDDHDGDTYRTVYTVKIAKAVYVLHCFKKKSNQGIATPKREIDLIKQRLKEAFDEAKEQGG
jgi:phage-related protein